MLRLLLRACGVCLVLAICVPRHRTPASPPDQFNIAYIRRPDERYDLATKWFLDHRRGNIYLNEYSPFSLRDCRELLAAADGAGGEPKAAPLAGSGGETEYWGHFALGSDPVGGGRLRIVRTADPFFDLHPGLSSNMTQLDSTVELCPGHLFGWSRCYIHARENTRDGPRVWSLVMSFSQSFGWEVRAQRLHRWGRLGPEQCSADWHPWLLSCPDD